MLWATASVNEHDSYFVINLIYLKYVRINVVVPEGPHR